MESIVPYLTSIVQNTRKPKYLLISLTRVLSVVFIFTNVLFAHKPEESFWKERGEKQNQQLASLPFHVSQGMAGVGRSQNAGIVIPPISLNKSGLTPTSFSFLTKTRKFKTPVFSQLPEGFLSHVQIRDFYQANGRSTVVLLEDVHLNKEAQGHLSHAIKAFGDVPGPAPVLVGLEGANGAFLYDVYKKFPDPTVATDVADSFLESGEISGPAHAGFTSYAMEGKRGLSFWGVDNDDLYRQNVAAYKNTKSIKNRVARELASLAREVEGEKGRAFSPELQTFDAAVMAYRAGSLPMADYLKLLTAANGSLSICAETFLQASTMEKTIDFKRIEAERTLVLEKLIKKLNDKDLSELVGLSLAYQNGVVGFADYYKELKATCERKGVSLARTPHFDEYIRYVLLTDGIKTETLLKEINSLENQAFNRLTTDEHQKNLVAQSRFVYLAGKLIDFSLTTGEWNDYKNAPGNWRLAPANNNPSSQSPVASSTLSPFERFYTSAEARNEKMVENLLGAGNREPFLSVLVAGGFHTDGLTRLLKEKGISYLVASPRITKLDVNNETHYLSVFDREKTPLEKIFAGQKLFLASVPCGAKNPAMDTPSALSRMVTGVLSKALPLNLAAGYVKRVGELRLQVPIFDRHPNQLIFKTSVVDLETDAVHVRLKGWISFFVSKVSGFFRGLFKETVVAVSQSNWAQWNPFPIFGRRYTATPIVPVRSAPHVGNGFIRINDQPLDEEHALLIMTAGNESKSLRTRLRSLEKQLLVLSALLPPSQRSALKKLRGQLRGTVKRLKTADFLRTSEPVKPVIENMSHETLVKVAQELDEIVCQNPAIAYRFISENWELYPAATSVLRSLFHNSFAVPQHLTTKENPKTLGSGSVFLQSILLLFLVPLSYLASGLAIAMNDFFHMYGSSLLGLNFYRKNGHGLSGKGPVRKLQQPGYFSRESGEEDNVDHRFATNITHSLVTGGLTGEFLVSRLRALQEDLRNIIKGGFLPDASLIKADVSTLEDLCHLIALIKYAEDRKDRNGRLVLIGQANSLIEALDDDFESLVLAYPHEVRDSIVWETRQNLIISTIFRGIARRLTESQLLSFQEGEGHVSPARHSPIDWSRLLHLSILIPIGLLAGGTALAMTTLFPYYATAILGVYFSKGLLPNFVGVNVNRALPPVEIKFGDKSIRLEGRKDLRTISEKEFVQLFRNLQRDDEGWLSLLSQFRKEFRLFCGALYSNRIPVSLDGRTAFQRQTFWAENEPIFRAGNILDHELGSSIVEEESDHLLGLVGYWLSRCMAENPSRYLAMVSDQRVQKQFPILTGLIMQLMDRVYVVPEELKTAVRSSEFSSHVPAVIFSDSPDGFSSEEVERFDALAPDAFALKGKDDVALSADGEAMLAYLVRSKGMPSFDPASLQLLQSGVSSEKIRIQIEELGNELDVLSQRPGCPLEVSLLPLVTADSRVPLDKNAEPLIVLLNGLDSLLKTQGPWVKTAVLDQREQFPALAGLLNQMENRVGPSAGQSAAPVYRSSQSDQDIPALRGLYPSLRRGGFSIPKMIVLIAVVAGAALLILWGCLMVFGTPSPSALKALWKAASPVIGTLAMALPVLAGVAIVDWEGLGDERPIQKRLVGSGRFKAILNPLGDHTKVIVVDTEHKHRSFKFTKRDPSSEVWNAEEKKAMAGTMAPDNLMVFVQNLNKEINLLAGDMAPVEDNSSRMYGGMGHLLFAQAYFGIDSNGYIEMNANDGMGRLMAFVISRPDIALNVILKGKKYPLLARVLGRMMLTAFQMTPSGLDKLLGHPEALAPLHAATAAALRPFDQFELISLAAGSKKAVVARRQDFHRIDLFLDQALDPHLGRTRSLNDFISFGQDYVHHEFSPREVINLTDVQQLLVEVQDLVVKAEVVPEEIGSVLRVLHSPVTMESLAVVGERLMLLALTRPDFVLNVLLREPDYPLLSNLLTIMMMEAYGLPSDDIKKFLDIPVAAKPTAVQPPAGPASSTQKSSQQKNKERGSASVGGLIIFTAALTVVLFIASLFLPQLVAGFYVAASMSLFLFLVSVAARYFGRPSSPTMAVPFNGKKPFEIVQEILDKNMSTEDILGQIDDRIIEGTDLVPFRSELLQLAQDYHAHRFSRMEIAQRMIDIGQRFNYLNLKGKKLSPNISKNIAKRYKINDVFQMLMIAKSTLARELSTDLNSPGNEGITNVVRERALAVLKAFVDRKVENGDMAPNDQKQAVEAEKFIKEWLEEKHIPSYIKIGMIRAMLESRTDDLLFAFGPGWRQFGTAGIRNQAVNSSFDGILLLELEEFGRNPFAPVLAGPNTINAVTILQQAATASLIMTQLRVYVEGHPKATEVNLPNLLKEHGLYDKAKERGDVPNVTIKLEEKFKKDLLGRKVTSAYDSRLNGRHWSKMLAAFFLRNGHKVDLFSAVAGMPILVYAASRLGSVFGFLVSASHSEPNYNGFKFVVGYLQSQVSPSFQKMIMTFRNMVDYRDMRLDLASAPEENLDKELMGHAHPVKNQDQVKHLPAIRLDDLRWLSDKDEAVTNEHIESVDIYTPYYNHVKARSSVERLLKMLDETKRQVLEESIIAIRAAVKILYTAFSGAGAVDAGNFPGFLTRMGYKLVDVIEKHTLRVDGRFPAFINGWKVGMPDPGSLEACVTNFRDFLIQVAGEDLANIDQAVQKFNAYDLMKATDPDIDRAAMILNLPQGIQGNVKEPLLVALIQYIEDSIPESDQPALISKVKDLMATKLNDKLHITANDAWMFLVYNDLALLEEQGQLRKDKVYVVIKSHMTTSGLSDIAALYQRNGYHVYVVDTWVGFTLLAERADQLFDIAKMAWRAVSLGKETKPEEALAAIRGQMTRSEKETEKKTLDDLYKPLEGRVSFIDEIMQEARVVAAFPSAEGHEQAISQLVEKLKVLAHLDIMAGVEESNGYGEFGRLQCEIGKEAEIVDEHIREKDGSLASYKFAELVAYLKYAGKSLYQAYMGMLGRIGQITATANLYTRYRGAEGASQKIINMAHFEKALAFATARAEDFKQDLVFFGKFNLVQDEGTQVFRDMKYDESFLGFPEEGVQFRFTYEQSGVTYKILVTYRPSGTGMENRDYNWVVAVIPPESQNDTARVEEIRQEIQGVLDLVNRCFFGTTEEDESPNQGLLLAMKKQGVNAFRSLFGKAMGLAGELEFTEAEEKLFKASFDFAGAASELKGKINLERRAQWSVARRGAQDKSREEWIRYLATPEAQEYPIKIQVKVGDRIVSIPRAMTLAWTVSAADYIDYLLGEKSIDQVSCDDVHFLKWIQQLHRLNAESSAPAAVSPSAEKPSIEHAKNQGRDRKGGATVESLVAVVAALTVVLFIASSFLPQFVAGFYMAASMSLFLFLVSVAARYFGRSSSPKPASAQSLAEQAARLDAALVGVNDDELAKANAIATRKERALSFLSQSAPKVERYAIGEVTSLELEKAAADHLVPLDFSKADNPERRGVIAFVLGLLDLIRKGQAQFISNSVVPYVASKAGVTDKTITVHIGERGSEFVESDAADLMVELAQAMVEKKTTPELNINVIVFVHVGESGVMPEGFLDDLKRRLDKSSIPCGMVLLQGAPIRNYRDLLWFAGERLAGHNMRAQRQFGALFAVINNEGGGKVELVTLSKRPDLYSADDDLIAMWTIITNLADKWVVIRSATISTLLKAAELAKQQA